MRTASLLAVAVSAVLGVALGIGGGLALDRGQQPVADPHQSFADPLSLDVPLVNQRCTGDFLLTIGKGNGASALAPGLAAYPQAHYLDTRSSCDLGWRVEGKATPRWVAYLGPYSSGAQPCRLRMTPAHKANSVAHLRQGSAPVRCLCYLGYKTLPTLHTGMTPGIVDVMWTFALQNMLIDLGRAPKTSANGVYDEATVAQVRRIQAERRLPVTGVVDALTWQAFQQHCDIYDVPSSNTSP